MYILAHNRVGNGNPSVIHSASTKGGPPQLPKEKDLLVANATSLQLNLFSWPDGGCPIIRFSIMYKALEEVQWNLVSSSASGEKLSIQNLLPGAWYQLKITAENDAGVADGLFHFATTTLSGHKVPPPPNLNRDYNRNSGISYQDAYVIVASVCVGILLICIGIVWLTVIRKKRYENITINTVLFNLPRYAVLSVMMI